MLSRQQKEFMKNLQKELQTQDHCGTAAPRYWKIRYTKQVPVDDSQWPAENITGFCIVDTHTDEIVCDTDDMKDLIETLVEQYNFTVGFFYENGQVRSVQALYDNICDEAYGYTDEPCCDDESVPSSADFTIRPLVDTECFSHEIFLTKKGAEEYLARYGYRFPKGAHAYCCCADSDNTEMKTLLQILETLDVESL